MQGHLSQCTEVSSLLPMLTVVPFLPLLLIEHQEDLDYISDLSIQNKNSQSNAQKM